MKGFAILILLFLASFCQFFSYCAFLWFFWGGFMTPKCKFGPSALVMGILEIYIVSYPKCGSTYFTICVIIPEKGIMGFRSRELQVWSHKSNLGVLNISYTILSDGFNFHQSSFRTLSERFAFKYEIVYLLRICSFHQSWNLRIYEVVAYKSVATITKWKSKIKKKRQPCVSQTMFV